MEKNDKGGENDDEKRTADHDRKDDRRRRDKKKGSTRKKRSSRHSSSEDDEYDHDSSYERHKRRVKRRSRKEDDRHSVDDSKTGNSEDEESQRRRKKKRGKSRRRSRRDESSSSSSSSDSDSDDDSRKHRKKRKDRKRKKHKSKKKKRSRRGSFEKDETSVTAGGGGAPTFGKYGIIKAADFLRMQRSFQVWLAEVKGIPSLPNSKHEQQKYFADFCEDFNTATMPHQKYYDYEKWEMQGKPFAMVSIILVRFMYNLVCLCVSEYEKQKAKEEKLSITGNTVLADEARHKREQQERAKAKQESERRALYGSMSREKVEEMKHQANLRTQMQIAYQTGDKKTYERLKERLESDT